MDLLLQRDGHLVQDAPVVVHGPEVPTEEQLAKWKDYRALREHPDFVRMQVINPAIGIEKEKTFRAPVAAEKEAAEKAAKAKREREEMKAAMARDRAEVAARGPAQASVARKLPSESGGTMTSAIFQEQEEAEARRNAQ